MVVPVGEVGEKSIFLSTSISPAELPFRSLRAVLFRCEAILSTRSLPSAGSAFWIPVTVQSASRARAKSCALFIGPVRSVEAPTPL